MKATETRLFKFLQKSAQFIIPIYQRQYSWTYAQCEQLWNDILRAGSTGLEGHFIGSVVYVERSLYSHSDVPELLVIDGQQRLTSNSLLIAALSHEITKRNEKAEQKIEIDGTNAKKLKNYYLCNAEEDGELYYKLVLTQSDNEALHKIVDGKVDFEEESVHRVEHNCRFFAGKLANLDDDELSHIYKGLQKLIIVDIALDKDKDDPQLIFESLNSTGLALSQADLIRNYVLMKQDIKEQNRLYKNYWFPMEKNFGHGEYSERFNAFMRDFLTLRTGYTPRKDEVYEGFKTYVTKSTESIQDIVAEVYRYSTYYAAFTLEAESQTSLREAFKDLNSYKVDVAYPLLLEMYNDYDHKVLALDEFVECVRYIESYAFRRLVCWIPTNSMNKTFARFSVGLKKDRYVESFKAKFLLLTGNRRMPLDSEFEHNLQTKDMYNMRSRSYWLRKLENYHHKDPIHVTEYTIEHVMPQNPNLSKAWQEALGENWQEVHETYLHTLGNLTLTGYNSELSDRSFQEKQSMEGGFADSHLRLNKGLAKLVNWDEHAIQQRAKELSKTMLDVWPCPQLDEETLNSYRQPEVQSAYSLEDHPYLNKEPVKTLYEKFKTQVLALDEDVREEFLKKYVAFKLDTNFVDVVPQASGLRLSLNMKFDEIHDPLKRCRDISGLGRWGNGDVEIKLAAVNELDYVMELVQQALDLQVGE
ncbi:GmrSD restriction endonuclease domain-containing protein [Endozoicomonas sp. ALD040]|uniref:GmrSD restriction endonuclease domain-containing protein n=1 Tax=Endozoicomonas sp. ALD040 TaxID=3403079 RepID=UPI003BAF2D8F